MRSTWWRIGIVFVAAVAACQVLGVKGNGRVQTQVRTVTAFDGIELSGGVEADVTVGAGQSVSITTDENLLPLVRTEVRGTRLFVGPMRSMRPTTLHATIVTPSLESLSVSGGVRANVHGISTPEFRLHASGGATVNLSGSAQQLDADLSGGVSLSARALFVQNASVHASGGVRADVNVFRAIDGSVSGGVMLRVNGNPPMRSVSSSGGASVQYL